MKMFPTAGLFLLQCIVLMVDISADPLIHVSPPEITLGTTSTLDINCTFTLSNHPDMAAFISLVLSRANATGQTFEELAAVTEFSPNSVTSLTQETVSATGAHSQTGESFLQVTWQYPTALQGGIYQCSAHGMDKIGHTIELTNISSVTVDKADLSDIFNKLRQLEQHIQVLENDKVSMENYITVLESNISHLESHVSHLEYNVSHLESNVSHLVNVVEFVSPVYLLGRYNTKSYYLSKYAFSDINKSIDVCRSLGGQLAVVNDQNELTAIQDFLKSTSGIVVVYISGSDEKTEGNWVLSDSDTPLPFTSWRSGSPHTSYRSYNCLILDYNASWTMADFYCHIDPPKDWYRFLCEI